MAALMVAELCVERGITKVQLEEDAKNVCLRCFQTIQMAVTEDK
jgi:hypothetical protein